VNFEIQVRRDDKWVEVPVGAGLGNQYVRLVPLVAIPMNEVFRVVDQQGLPGHFILGGGDPGDYLVLDNGVPRAEEGNNFRVTHAQIPLADNDLVALRSAILRLLNDKVEFADPGDDETLADGILTLIGTMEVAPQ
jgi:hypothetical protein